MIKESIKKRFQKMVKYCDELIEKCKNKTIDDLYVDKNFAEASCFVLGLIGEQVPGFRLNSNGVKIKDDDYDEFYEKYKEINWSEIKGARNKIFHDYDGVNMQLIWETLEDIPSFKEKILEIINKND